MGPSYIDDLRNGLINSQRIQRIYLGTDYKWYCVTKQGYHFRLDNEELEEVVEYLKEPQQSQEYYKK